MNYRIKETGKIVKLGDIITIKSEENTEFGKVQRTLSCTLLPHNLGKFLDAGIIEEVKSKKNYNYYINFLAEKLSIPASEVKQMIKILMHG